MGLVGLDIDDEDQCVVLFHLLHGTLGVERVDDNFVFVQARLMGDGLSGVLRRSGENQSLRSMERVAQPNLAVLGRVRL